MSTLMLRSVLAVVAVALPSVALACDQDGHAEVKQVSINEVVALQQAKKGTLVDVNNSSTRAKLGTIPGAVLLTDYRNYDAAKELPQSKEEKLVFYCASTQCGASHAAAERALTLGYKDVNVMPDGIAGWKTAGHPTVKPQS